MQPGICTIVIKIIRSQNLDNSITPMEKCRGKDYDCAIVACVDSILDTNDHFNFVYINRKDLYQKKTDNKSDNFCQLSEPSKHVQRKTLKISDTFMLLGFSYSS